MVHWEMFMASSFDKDNVIQFHEGVKDWMLEEILEE